MKSKILIVVQIFLGTFFISCEYDTESLQGLWISENEDYVYFKNDTVSSPYQFPEKFELKDGYLKIGDLEWAIEFQSRNQITLEIDSSDFLVVSKSKFNNLYDHRLDKMGISLELPVGFSRSRYSSKRHFEDIYFGYDKNDSLLLFLNEEKMELEKMVDVLRSKSKFIHLNIACDKNVIFSDYYEKLKAIFKDNLKGKVYHSIKDSTNQYTRKIWGNVSTISINHYFLDDEFRDIIENKSQLSKIRIDKQGDYLLNENIVEKIKLSEKLDSIFSLNTRETTFEIIESKNLTYGDYIFLVSAINRIVYRKRDEFAIKDYGKNWYELEKEEKISIKPKAIRTIIMGKNSIH